MCLIVNKFLNLSFIKWGLAFDVCDEGSGSTELEFLQEAIRGHSVKGGGRGGAIPVTRRESSLMLTLLLPFKIGNPFYLTSSVTQNNDWIFENIRLIVKFVFIFFSFPSVYCDLALHT